MESQVSFTPENIKSITDARSSASLALSALEKLLLERLASQEDAALLEKGIVTCIWMATSSPALNGGLEPLISMMARLNGDFGTRLGSETAQASLIVSHHIPGV
jgi:hypothetical protein